MRRNRVLLEPLSRLIFALIGGTASPTHGAHLTLTRCLRFGHGLPSRTSHLCRVAARYGLGPRRTLHLVPCGCHEDTSHGGDSESLERHARQNGGLYLSKAYAVHTFTGRTSGTGALASSCTVAPCRLTRLWLIFWR